MRGVGKEGTEGRRHGGTEGEESDSYGVKSALAELREDYSGRIGKTLGLAAPPRVFVISAIQPSRFDLPELRLTMMRAKTASLVKESKELAAQRQERSLLGWLGTQELPVQARSAGPPPRGGGGVAFRPAWGRRCWSGLHRDWRGTQRRGW